jgi:hypothetical protein
MVPWNPWMKPNVLLVTFPSHNSDTNRTVPPHAWLVILPEVCSQWSHMTHKKMTESIPKPRCRLSCLYVDKRSTLRYIHIIVFTGIGYPQLLPLKHIPVIFPLHHLWFSLTYSHHLYMIFIDIPSQIPSNMIWNELGARHSLHRKGQPGVFFEVSKTPADLGSWYSPSRFPVAIKLAEYNMI